VTPDIHRCGRAYGRDDDWSNDVRRSTYWYDLHFPVEKRVLTTMYRLCRSLGTERNDFSGNNLALLYSATKTYDPEVNNPGVYPAMRTFAVGANITF
jgi:hypothetical protein